jgi:hypothetical protein
MPISARADIAGGGRLRLLRDCFSRCGHDLRRDTQHQGGSQQRRANQYPHQECSVQAKLAGSNLAPVFRGMNEKQARRAGLFRCHCKLRSPMTVPAPVVPSPMAMTPSAMPAPVAMVTPAHLGRQLPGVILHRSRSAWIDQRYRAGTLDRSSYHQNRGNGRKAQNFRPIHLVPPSGKIAPAPYGLSSNRPPRRRWIGKTSGVNAD